MTTQDPQADAATDLPAGPAAADRHVTFLPDPVVDNLLRAVVTLTMELSVTRERLKSLEQVLDNQGLNVSSGIETLARDAEDDNARRVERERLIQSILAPIVGGLTGKS